MFRVSNRSNIERDRRGVYPVSRRSILTRGKLVWDVRRRIFINVRWRVYRVSRGVLINSRWRVYSVSREFHVCKWRQVRRMCYRLLRNWGEHNV